MAEAECRIGTVAAESLPLPVAFLCGKARCRQNHGLGHPTGFSRTCCNLP